MKKKIWYGDTPNRKCDDCGKPVDWDERLRLGLVPIGGPTDPDGYTPQYDSAGNYSNTPRGRAEQAKLEAHYEKFHSGGMVKTLEQGLWRLEVRRYSTDLAFERKCLKAGLLYYGILSTSAPNGKRISSVIEACATVEEVMRQAGFVETPPLL